MADPASKADAAALPPGLAQALLDQFEEAVFVSRRDETTLRFLLVNEAACRLMGYSRAELLAIAPPDVVPGEDPRRDLYQRRVERVRRGETIEFHTFVKTKGGGWIPVRSRTSPFRFDGQDLVISRLVALRDDARGGEGDVLLLRQHVTELLQSAPVGIFLTDAEGRILFQNDALKAMMGTAPDAPSPVVGRSVLDLPGIRGLPSEAAVRSVVGGERLTNYVTPYTSVNGVSIVCSINAAPLLDSGGRPDGALFVVTDVTEIQRMEAEVRQAQRLESLAVLAGGIAHDFNNLLEAITGRIAIAREDLPDGHPGTGHLVAAERIAGRAAALVGQLLSVVRRDPAERRVFDLVRVVQDSEELLETAAGRSVRVSLELPDVELPVQGSPDQVVQVLLNLAVNARDAMGGEGRLVVRAGPVPEGIAVPGAAGGDPVPAAFVEVEDTGPGIPSDLVDRIFDPFFTTRTGPTSAGLGLAVVHGIARSHGGRVEAISPPGRGARLRVLLPLHAPVAALPASGDGGRVAAEAVAILLVEDEPALRDVFTHLLERAGYGVVSCGRGQDAIDLFRQHPDLRAMVLDFQLPDIGGGEVLRTIRRESPGFPTVITTGYAPEEALAPWIDQPGIRYLQKPFAFRRLAEELALLLGGAPG
ncbi:PAS domain-containing protein [Myxococcota bacterium]|nr:PAS domain-containing protein [Myxococcota bacterium]